MRIRNLSSSHVSFAALVLGGITIGFSPLLVRTSEIGPVTTAFWRVAIALVPLFIWMSADRRETARPPASVTEAVQLLAPGVLLAADLLAWHLAIHRTSIANATLLANLAPIFVVLGNWVLFGRRASRPFLIGLGISIGGVALLTGATSRASGSLHGDALGILAAIMYAGYIFSLAHLRTRYSTRSILLWSSLSAAACLLPAALLLEAPLFPESTRGWLILLALGLFCHFGGQGLITFALARLPASFSSLTLLIQPVVASVGAWLLLGEALSPSQAAGGCIVLAGIVIARRGKDRAG